MATLTIKNRDKTRKVINLSNAQLEGFKEIIPSSFAKKAGYHKRRSLWRSQSNERKLQAHAIDIAGHKNYEYGQVPDSVYRS